MTLLGGMGTVFGTIMGAAIIVAMQNYLATFGAWVTIMHGVIFVISVPLFREGVVGVLAKRFRKGFLMRLTSFRMLCAPQADHQDVKEVEPAIKLVSTE